MAGGVYSTRFIMAAGAAGGSYTVPPGYRAVVKALSVINLGASTGNYGLLVAGVQVWFGSVPGPGASAVSGLMLVVYTGEKLQLNHGSSSFTSMVSGFLLAG